MSHALAFDTYEFIKTLESSGFDEKQAEALSNAIKKVQESHLEELANKQDIKELELRLETKIVETNHTILLVKRDIKELEVSLKRDMKELELCLGTKIAETKADIIKWCVGAVFTAVGLFATITTVILKIFLK